MKKFEKAVATSVLSIGIAAGTVAVGASIDHSQNADRRACFERLDGADQEACLSEVSRNTSSEQLLEIGALAGVVAAIAAGVQAYRTLAKEN